MSTSTKNQAGFTLIEMLIVVVILGVLSTLAIHGYSKWIGRARRSEAVAMLAEISAKEQIYLNQFAAYHPLRNDGKNPPDVPSPDELAFYAEGGGPAKATFWRGEGCNFCGGTGYLDRIGVYELLTMTDEIRQLLLERPSARQLREAATRDGMSTLREEGIRLVTEDVTTVAEVMRAIYVL